MVPAGRHTGLASAFLSGGRSGAGRRSLAVLAPANGVEVVARPPLSTYRLQLTPEFGFERAAEIARYLARLGVTHLYASPYLQAAPGSGHGYDVVDHSRVNEELGGEAGHSRLLTGLAEAGLGQSAQEA